ncbi:MAG: hypothetical protein LBS21_09560 [Clostridiales bacterium]|jgi:hypothetical protein|nr:hypothetical protein [Clostridiales bacterium]
MMMLPPDLDRVLMFAIGMVRNHYSDKPISFEQAMKCVTGALKASKLIGVNAYCGPNMQKILIAHAIYELKNSPEIKFEGGMDVTEAMIPHRLCHAYHEILAMAVSYDAYAEKKQASKQNNMSVT